MKETTRVLFWAVNWAGLLNSILIRFIDRPFFFTKRFIDSPIIGVIHFWGFTFLSDTCAKIGRT